MGSGIAKGAQTRGKRIAFGDTRRIHWRRPHAHEIFAGNPNVAPPGSECASDIEWVRHYSGHRLYAKPGGGRWLWNYSFKATPGEVFLTPEEKAFAAKVPAGFVLIEPRVKMTAPNKQWPYKRYIQVAQELIKAGHKVYTPNYHGVQPLVAGVHLLPYGTFRQALALLARASLYIGPEGGLHHGAAAMGTRAVVIFGGFISPRVTGYDAHVNLASAEACGNYGRRCHHCEMAMNMITTNQVVQAALSQLKEVRCEAS